jgi:hypothetical protein
MLVPQLLLSLLAFTGVILHTDIVFNFAAAVFNRPDIPFIPE